MRLVATGLFVRASRNVRLAALPPPVRGPSNLRVRWTSTETVEKEEGWQENDTKALTREATSSVQNTVPRQAAPQTQPDSETAQPPDPRKLLEAELVRQNKEKEVIKAHGHSGILISSKPYVYDSTTNLSPSITGLLNRSLYTNPNHPICITRKLIESVFAAPEFKNHIASDPVATTHANFDVLGFPLDHPGRARSDTYYINDQHVLRTHTSAHQHVAFQHMQKKGEQGFTICADVFRRDSIDRSHFPVFHQMEGARMWTYPVTVLEKSRHQREMERKAVLKSDVAGLPSNKDIEVVGHNPALDARNNPKQKQHNHEDVRLVVTHLKRTLETLVCKVFTAAQSTTSDPTTTTPEKLKVRWVDAYFPFTAPSFELEVFWQGEWLELLGCGVTQQSVLVNAGLKNHIGWAWGIGVERLAMLLFGIPDIRLFWSQDPRFLNQFKEGQIKKYEPFSKHPACYKDVAFWINDSVSSPAATDTTAIAAGGDATKSTSIPPPSTFHENDVMEIVRDVAGSLAEDVSLVDEFVHPTTKRKSVCYRVNYRSLERTLTNDEVNAMHAEVLARLASELEIELR